MYSVYKKIQEILATKVFSSTVKIGTGSVKGYSVLAKENGKGKTYYRTMNREDYDKLRMTGELQQLKKLLYLQRSHFQKGMMVLQ